jgi:membrane protease YdiL (CAAX protease family)
LSSKGSVLERSAITIICFGYLTLSSVAAVVFGLRNFEYTNAAVMTVLSLEIVFAAVAIGVLRHRGWSAGDFPMQVSLRSTLEGVALFVVAMIACSAAYVLVAATGALEGWTQMSIRLTAAPALVLLFLVVNSMYEELFVAAYLVEATRASGLAFAVSISAVVRLLYHTYQGPVAFASIVPIGILFGFVYARYRNLWVIVVAHTLINLLSWART